MSPFGPLTSGNLGTGSTEGVGLIQNLSFFGTTTLTGTGTRISYLSLPAANQLVLENAASSGTVLPLIEGTGFGDLTMQKSAAVPEPSSFLRLGLVALGFAGMKLKALLF